MGKTRKTVPVIKTVSPAAAPGVPRRSSHEPVAHLSVDERVARGKAARTDVPRDSHEGFEPLPGRRDPLEILEVQAATRVPELIPVRYGRMAASPFAFYRGAAAIMAADLAGTPRSGLTVQACGDAHLVNFGLYNSPERRLVFDINDFDETLPGPWEWDVKRLAASFVVAGRSRGFSSKQRAAGTLAALGAYRSAMRQFSGMTALEIWYAKLELDQIMVNIAPTLDSRRTKLARGIREKAQGRDNLQAFGKLTTMVDGEPRFTHLPPLIVPLAELVSPDQAAAVTRQLHDVLRSYRATLSDDRRRLVEQYRLVDVARKVVGVGSVGTRAWMVLLLGRDSADPLLLQAKEAQASVLEPYVGRSRYEQAGRRVVAGQRLMQSSSDIFLGWHRGPGLDGVRRDFYLRQLRDGKGGFDPNLMRPEGMAMYGQACGWTLARAHARSGDPVAIAAYLGANDSFDRAVLDFSEAYADQNERDHAALVEAIAGGRIPALEGV